MGVIGESVDRTDAIGKVTGRYQYATDLKLAGMLRGRALRSPLAYARIAALDVERARRLPGVRAVVTGKDVPYLYGSTVKDRPFLAVDVVRFAGEPVAAVAAVDEDTAQEALDLIRVDYEPLEPLLDPERAMEAGASLLHPDLGKYKHSYAARPLAGTNICSHFQLRRGDVEEGFAEADDVFEDTFRTRPVQHAALEPHVAVAQVDGFSGRITVWVNSVSPFISRTELADALGVPMDRIRVIVPGVGGSFGGKMYLKQEPLAVALAMFAGNRPVRVASDREEEFTAQVVRGGTLTRLKTGVRRDGTIVARQVTTVWDTGAYADCGPRIARNSGHTSAGPYRIPNLRIDGYTVYTNKIVAGAYRGYGVTEVTWAYETQMDMIAERLGIDRLELRRRNILREGDAGATGQPVVAVGLGESLDRAAGAIAWGRESGPGRGKGVACTHKATGAPSMSSAVIKVNEDGSVVLLSSTVEQGQGSDTVLRQMVADELGVPLDRVTVTAPDTDYTPFDSSTTSSRSTFHMGNAVRLAVQDIRGQLRELNLPGDLSLREAIARQYGARGGTLIGRGLFRPDAAPMDPETAQTDKVTPFWMYAAQAAEVEVDLETGRVEVRRLAAAHDVGRAINPLTALQQIEGALVMGLGSALYEEMRVGPDGRLQNANLHDYKLPTALDVPGLEPMTVEQPHPDGPYGAKGVGEPGLAPTAPAIANAVAAATGIRFTDLPITAERLYLALKRRGAAEPHGEKRGD